MVTNPSIPNISATNAPHARPALWRGVDVLLMSVSMIVLVVAGAVGLGLLFGRSLDMSQVQANASNPALPVEFTLGVLALQFVAMTLSVWLLGLRRRGYTWADIGLVPTTRGWVAGAVGLFVVLRIAVVIILLILAALGITSMQAQALAPGGFSWVGAVGNVILAGVLVPVAEEIFFRGVLYRWLRDKWGVAVGVITSGVVFGVAHFEPATVVPAILLGMVLALVYERSRSLWPSIIIHALNNLSAVVLLYALLGSGVKLPS